MLELCRTVRLGVSPWGPPPPLGDAGPTSGGPIDNAHSAWPPLTGLSRYFELHACCRGHADAVTGYFIDIRTIDRAVRTTCLPLLHAAVTREAREQRPAPLGPLMRDMLDALHPALDRTLHRLTLDLSPRLSTAMTTQAPDRVLLRQQYEFAAAHRLHAAGLSDEQNRDTFGKCNNPSGHGHNYLVDVTVSLPADGDTPVSPAELDAVVDHHALQHLDHKHLNRDVPQFADRNPSVEHIVQVVWQMLEPPVQQLAAGHARLDEVTVWETGKTACTYRGG
jgi:6-pyruvoyltetrahydropterin/6-carboxytetrahydropterin synthase